MAQRTPPLYGRLTFSDIDTLIGRLSKVANRYLHKESFSAYVTTHDRQNFYGLDDKELAKVCEEQKGKIKSLVAACSGPNEKSVNVNVRFGKNESASEGQFVIVAGSKFQANEISQILRGEWIELEPEVLERNIAIGELLVLLKDLGQKKIEAAEKMRAEKIARQLVALEPGQFPRKRSRTITTIRDRFSFDDQIAVDVIIDLLKTLSGKFLNHAPFNIRVITTSGDSYSDIGQKGLRKFFERRKELVLKVFMDAATPEGELIDMMLVFGPTARRQNAEIEITAAKSKEIQAVVRQMFEPSTETEIAATAMVHEMFRFDQFSFSLSQVIGLITIISNKYLQRESPTAFLSTLQGETYPALTLDQLEKVYMDHRNNVSFLLFGINQSLTGQTFSLMFQFQSPGQEPYGSLSMMWGDQRTHKAIRSAIWEQLRLKPYRKNIQPAVPQALPKAKAMEVNPIFHKREFEFRPLTCLILMPLEAYWSESLWVHLHQTMKATGYDSIRADALFSKEVLEDTWTSLNIIDLVIADLTYKHPDVFYKLGVAHTLGKKILLISQHARDIPFDFKNFPHVVYDNNINGIQRLSDRVLEWVRR